jgi:cytochrome c oxidase cbb3-type subunit I/II
LLPKIFRTELYSKKLAGFHFWIGTIGILFYAIPLYWAGFTQSLMWKEFTADGFLKYPNFLETVVQILPMYRLRVIGGALYLTGVITMVYNLYKTVKSGKLVANEEAEAPALLKESGAHKGEHWHRSLERKPVVLLILSLIVILIGGIAEMVPTFLVKSNIPTISSVKPYTPLELEGRDLYVREGCYNCHSQMVRPFRSETERYGEYSKSGEFVYDHPFQWGSKRTGPDLHRVGKKYPDSWHFNHMLDPATMSPGSIMPSYPWLIEDELNTSDLPAKIRAMQKLGVPYEPGYDQQALSDLQKQAAGISATLAMDNIDVQSDREIIALIAYLQRLGTDIKATPQQSASK